MGYRHIPTTSHRDSLPIFHFSQVFCMEKIDGTSAHISWNSGSLTFSSGGATPAAFEKLFDRDNLTAHFSSLGFQKVTVYGEAYGGKIQKMGNRYGKDLRFAVFDVKIGDEWLNVSDAASFAEKAGLEFVPYKIIPMTREAIDAERDAPSVQAERNGMGPNQDREGVVLRPLLEFYYQGDVIRVKHRRPENRETTSIQPLATEKQEVLTGAKAIAHEWVTPARLNHVMDHLTASLGREVEIRDTPVVLTAMVEDVYREAAGVVLESKEATNEIKTRTRILFHSYLQSRVPCVKK